MKLPLFKLESYFQKWEFKAPYQFCNSDIETLSLKELLALADPEGKDLWDQLRLGYTEVSGSEPLRQEVSHLYKRINSDHVLLFSGGEEGIFSLFQSMLTAGDHVIVVTPCYQSHISIPEAMGCKVSQVRLDPRHNWKLNLNQIRDLIFPNTKLIVINFPHNPTGSTLSRKEADELIEIARQGNIPILSDEVYRFSELEPENQIPPLADLYERAMSLGVLSKSFGLAGLRVGWIATQDEEVIQKLAQVKHYLSICGSGPSEALAVIALRAKEKILSRNHEILRTNLELLDVFFDKYPHLVRWVRPTGGCAGFPELLIPEPIESFAEKLIQEEGVLILPGSNYDWPGNFFRLGFGRKNMPQSLERFERYLCKR